MRNKLAKLVKAFAVCALMPVGISTPAQIVGTGPAEARHLERFCEDYAHGYASCRARTGIAANTLRGAGTGALIGGISNGGRGAGRGAAIGAGVGLVAASGARGKIYDFYYRRAFRRCIIG
jgi:hypothetical protein